jgi:hypothetical protein
MPNQIETASYDGQLDKLAEALAAARRMQQDWLTYGLNFVHIYVEDVDGDWLDAWNHDERSGRSLLDAIKEFLVTDDVVAVQVRQQLGERSLYDFAVNLAECGRITDENDRLSTIKNLLASHNANEKKILNLAHALSNRFFQ